jgi:hypothetical protein
MQAMVEQFAGQLRDASEAAQLERARAVAEIADLNRDLDIARAAAQQALQDVEALAHADAERKARGLVARLRAAWRGR